MEDDYNFDQKAFRDKHIKGEEPREQRVIKVRFNKEYNRAVGIELQ